MTRIAACMFCLCPVFPAFAHHSPAAYDQSLEIIIEGVVSDVSWRNPHVYLTIASIGADGTAVMQEIEAAAASSLITMGVQQDDLRTGERVSVRVHPRRGGAGGDVLGVILTNADGKELALRSGAVVLPPQQKQATSLAGTWSTDARAFLQLALVSQSWPFTPAGKSAAADLATRTAAASDCAPFGVPVLMVMPSVVTTTVTEENVTFYLDAESTSRVIHLGIATVPDGIQPSREGYAIGQWEGDTLVVETTAFAQDPEGLGFGGPSSDQKHLLERFMLSEDRLAMRYEATVEDPYYLTEPVSISSTWAYRPDLTTSGQGCTLESAQRFNITP